MRGTAASLGYFVGSLAPLAIGIAVAFYLRKKRGEDKLPGWPIIVGLVLTILSCVGTTSSKAATAPARAAVSDQQMLGIVRAIAGHDAGQLRNWVGDRVFFTEAVGDLERKSPESVVETLRPCTDRKIVRFTGDPDIFVLWDCPHSPWKGPAFLRPGFLTMLTSRSEGLTLIYSLEGFPTGAAPAPPVIRLPKPERG